MGTGKVAIIVLNWNRGEDTVECLDSLLPNVQQGIASIICCDNGSTDNSVQIILNWARQHFIASIKFPDRPVSSLEPQHSAFVLIETGANLGYAGGNNIGIRYVMNSGMFDYIWILNNDAVVESGALSALLAVAAASPDVGAFGSTLVDFDNPKRVQCAGGCRYYPALTIMRPAYEGKKLKTVLEHPHTVKLDYVCGAAMFLRTEAVRETGLLNENYFLYYEEADYAKRLASKGFRIGWCRESIVRHKGGTSTGSGSRNNRRSSWISSYHENLSTLKFTADHYPLLLPIACIFRLLMKLLIMVIFKRWHTFLPVMQAYSDFLFRRHRHDRSLLFTPHLLFTGDVNKQQTPRTSDTQSFTSGASAC